MSDEAVIGTVLRQDPLRWHLLGIVQSLSLPDCWIGAGFVRNAVWDHLHGRAPTPVLTDVDVIWFDANNRCASLDRDLERQLLLREPAIAWSVKNQARMHQRNGDAPYRSSTDAMRYWPETATAVAARRLPDSTVEIAAPHGLGDLFNLIVRPTPRFLAEKRDIFDNRVRSKRWGDTWPRLTTQP